MTVHFFKHFDWKLGEIYRAWLLFACLCLNCFYSEFKHLSYLSQEDYMQKVVLNEENSD